MEESPNPQISVPTKPLTFEELAILFAVQTITLKKWLKPYQQEIGDPEVKEVGISKFSLPQMHIIFEKLTIKQ